MLCCSQQFSPLFTKAHTFSCFLSTPPDSCSSAHSVDLEAGSELCIPNLKTCNQTNSNDGRGTPWGKSFHSADYVLLLSTSPFMRSVQIETRAPTDDGLVGYDTLLAVSEQCSRDQTVATLVSCCKAMFNGTGPTQAWLLEALDLNNSNPCATDSRSTLMMTVESISTARLFLTSQQMLSTTFFWKDTMELVVMQTSALKPRLLRK